MLCLSFVFTQLQLDSPSQFTSNLSPEAMENLKEELNNTLMKVQFCFHSITARFTVTVLKPYLAKHYKNIINPILVKVRFFT